MGIIIAIENSKGGVSKSTLTSNIARQLQLDGHSVLIIDRNPDQGTIRIWREKAEINYPMVVSVHKPTLHNDIKQISDSFDYILIDGASILQEMAASSVRAADVVIVPISPSTPDIDGCRGLISLIKERQMVTEGKPRAIVVITKNIVGTRLSKGMESGLLALEMPVCKTRISQSVAYVEAMGTGTTVLDVPAYAYKAKEIRALVKELKEFIHG
jgi:chromosome partitioning protein